MKKISCLFVATLLLTGCARSPIGHSFSDMFLFSNVPSETVAITSGQSEPTNYTIEVRRLTYKNEIENPVEHLQLIIDNDETTAVEGMDFSLSTKNLILPKEETLTSFTLTVMPVTSMKTLTLRLAYTHPQLLPTDGYGLSGRWARFQITPADNQE